MNLRAGIAVAMLVAIAVRAQSRPESGPATRTETKDALESLRPAMQQLRAGAPDVESVRVVVEGLLKTEHAIAAPWWIALHEENARDEKLTAADREVLARLKRASERPESFVEERKMILKVIREVESLIASKAMEPARQAATIARGMIGLIPDAILAKRLAEVEKKLPPAKADEIAKSNPVSLSFEGELNLVCTRLAAVALAAYEKAGCRSGRLVLARSIRDFALALPPRGYLNDLGRLREIAKSVEATSALSVFIRTIGTARFFRDGDPLVVTEGGAAFEASTAPPLEIAVIPGDVVTIAIDEPYSGDSVGASFVVALNARYESKDLGTKDLFVDVSETPGKAGSRLYPVPIALKKPDPPKSLFGRTPEQDADLKKYNTYFELPKLLQRSVDVPCLGDMIGFGREFDAKKLAAHWIGAEAQHFAVVIKVPGG